MAKMPTPTVVVTADDFGAVLATVHAMAAPSACANFVSPVNVTTPGVAARRDRRDTTTVLTSRVSWVGLVPMVNLSPMEMSDTSLSFIELAPLRVAPTDEVFFCDDADDAITTAFAFSGGICGFYFCVDIKDADCSNEQETKGSR